VQLILRSGTAECVDRNAARYSAWQALHLSLSFSSGRIAAHHANFWAGAVAKVQLILRRCGCGVGGVERASGANST